LMVDWKVGGKGTPGWVGKTFASERRFEVHERRLEM
jgi:hypothetical protein